MSRCACLKRTIYVSIRASFRDSTMNEFCSRARQLYASVQRERRPYKCTCLFCFVASEESVHRNLEKKYFPTCGKFFFFSFSPEVKTRRITSRAEGKKRDVIFIPVIISRLINSNSFLLVARQWIRRRQRIVTILTQYPRCNPTSVS